MRFVLDVLGLIVAVFGALTVTRDKPGGFRPMHILANEIPWAPTLLGTLLVLTGLRRKRKPWAGILLGGVGAMLASTTFLRWRAATDDMESAFKAGFGADYLERIPAAARERLSRRRASVADSLGLGARRTQGRLIRDIEFARPEGQALHLDVYQPMLPPAMGERYPAVLVIHGGGWRNGDKHEYFETHSRHLANQGYVVFDIQYRLATVSKWPAQMDDVKAAIRWVRCHAEEYQIDPDQIHLLGRSAGAHLALMTACCPDADTPVAGVVSVYGPTELRWEGLAPDSPIVELMGGTYEMKRWDYETASPVALVREGLPPILLIEGGMDALVPNTHGDLFAGRMYLMDSPFAVLRIPWSRHGFDAVYFGLGAQVAQYYIDRFLAWSAYAAN
jgi:acetyl esterase/lipase